MNVAEEDDEESARMVVPKLRSIGHSAASSSSHKTLATEVIFLVRSQEV
jgi:hypothetical protein